MARALPSDSAMRLMCVGLLCLGSRDAARQVCSPGSLMAVGGVAEICPCSGAGLLALPKADRLLPGSARSGLTQPDPSLSLGRAWHPHEHTAVRAEHAQAPPAEAPASDRSAPGPRCPEQLRDGN